VGKYHIRSPEHFFIEDNSLVDNNSINNIDGSPIPASIGDNRNSDYHFINNRRVGVPNTPNSIINTTIKTKPRSYIKSSNYVLNSLEMSPFQQNHRFQAKMFDISNFTITDLKIESFVYSYKDQPHTRIDFNIDGIDLDGGGAFKYEAMSIFEDSGLFRTVIRKSNISISIIACPESTGDSFTTNNIHNNNDSHPRTHNSNDSRTIANNNNNNDLSECSAHGDNVVRINGDLFYLNVTTTIPNISIQVSNTLLAPVYNLILRRFESKIAQIVSALVTQNIVQYLQKFLPQSYRQFLITRNRFRSGVANSIYMLSRRMNLNLNRNNFNSGDTSNNNNDNHLNNGNTHNLNHNFNNHLDNHRNNNHLNNRSNNNIHHIAHIKSKFIL
jgi:hypothetical protein